MSALGLSLPGSTHAAPSSTPAFDQVTRLTVDDLAGNVVLACVAGMEPAVVAHVEVVGKRKQAALQSAVEPPTRDEFPKFCRFDWTRPPSSWSWGGSYF